MQESFIRTMLEVGYSGAAYGSPAERRAALDGLLHHYNHHRRHQAIGRQPTMQRQNNATRDRGEAAGT